MADPVADRARLEAEVAARFGVLPNFFRLTPGVPGVTADLWGFARVAYLDNPLPALFKERLFVHLSRFCEVRYCIARHVGFLVGLGRPAGDPAAPPEPVEAVVRLLLRPVPRAADLKPLLADLADAPAPLPDLPASGAPLEEAVFACAAHVFLDTPDAPACLDTLRRALGDGRFQHLMVFLAFVRTAHFWSKVQPGLRMEDDVRELLATQEELARAVFDDQEGRAAPVGRALAAELASLRDEVQRRDELLREEQSLRQGEGEQLRQSEAERAARVADLQRANAELTAARRAALNLMEDAIQARDALRASEGRQAFLLRLSDALRPLAGAAAVQETASRLLGEHLAVDRAYYVEVDEARGVALVRHDYHRSDSPSLTGEHQVSAFGWVIPPMRRGEMIVVPDVTASPLVPAADRAAMAAVRIAAHVNTPLVKNGRLVGALCLTEDRSRAWTTAEVELVRETGERIWAAVERANAEAALRQSEERLRAVAANLPNGAVFVVDPDIRYQLAAGEALTAAGLTPADLEGKTVTEAVPPEVASVFTGNYRRALAGTPFRTEHEFHDRHYVTHGAPLRDAAGYVSAVLAVSYDITDREQAQADRARSEGQLRLLLENVRDHAIFALGPTGNVASWNEGAERLLGYAADEVVGTSAARFFTPEDRAAGLFERELAAAAATGRAADDNWIVRKDGSRFWASGSTSAVAGPAHRPAGFVKVFRDRTEHRAAEEAVREARDRLRMALAAARMGIWSWHVPTNTQTRDANLNQLLGLPAADTAQPFDEFLTHMHPADRAAVRAAFDTSVRQGRPLNTEFRVVWPDGTVRWLRDQGDVFGAADGADRHMTGACVDITDLKAAEDALRQARDELEDRVRERTAELVAAEAGRRELLGRLVTGQEEERRRIARELHDSLGQYLTALGLGLGAARDRAASPEDRDRLDRLAELTTETGREVHRLAIELRPTALDDLGLRTSLQQYVEAWSARTKVTAEFASRGLDGERFSWQVSTAVYRVVQEALTNVARHARASRVSVLVERGADFLRAIVEDNGVGFDPDRAPTDPRTGGLGLLGMRERVALVNGTLLIESSPDGGTTVFVRVPVPPPEPDDYE